MNRIQGLGVMVAAVLAVLGCSPKIKPGLVVHGEPVDEVSATSPGGSMIVATFDRPMVAPAMVGQVVTKAPCVVRPKVEGEYRWTTDRILGFFPKTALPKSTHYEVEIPKGTRALDGYGLDAPVRWAFDYERSTLDLSFPSKGSPDATRWATPDVSAKLVLSQPALLKTVRRACSFRAEGKKIGVALPKEQDEETPRKTFEFGPEAPLALDTAWTLRCDESLTSVEGPLAPKPAELAFRTYGPMVSRATCTSTARASRSTPGPSRR